jgi:hypothetical protein
MSALKNLPKIYQKLPEKKITSRSALLKGWWGSSLMKPMLINICVCACSRVMHPREQHKRPPTLTHL